MALRSRYRPGTAITLALALAASQAAILVLTPVLGDVAADLGVSTATAGQLRTVSGLAAAVTALAAGLVATRIGLRDLLAFGLGLLLDILVGGLSGGCCPPAPDEAKASNNVLLVVWDPATFAGHEHLLSQAEALLRFVRSSRRRPGVDAIRLAGDGSDATRRQRAAGIPLDGGTWSALVSLAGELRVAVPDGAR